MVLFLALSLTMLAGAEAEGEKGKGLARQGCPKDKLVVSEFRTLRRKVTKMPVG